MIKLPSELDIEPILNSLISITTPFNGLFDSLSNTIPEKLFEFWENDKLHTVKKIEIDKINNFNVNLFDLRFYDNINTTNRIINPIFIELNITWYK